MALLRWLVARAGLGVVLAGASVAHAQNQLLPALPETAPDPARDVRPPEQRTAPSVGAAGVGPSFVLRGMDIEGASALSRADLAPAWQEFVGTYVTVGTLEEIAERIGAVYRKRGYFLSQAVLPAQSISNGIVRIVVVEGFVDHVSLTGGARNQRRIAEKYFAPVPADRPLRLQTLERSVLLSRDTFGSAFGESVETVLEPSPGTFGAADLGVLITPQPVSGYVTVDNRGSRVYGDLTFGAGVRSYNALGLNERLDGVIAFVPDGGSLALGALSDTGSLVYGSLSFEAPVEPLLGTYLDGARLRINVNAARSDPDLSQIGSPQSLTTILNERELTLGLSVPFMRGRSQNLFGSIGITARDSETETSFSGGTSDERDRLAILQLGLSWDVADHYGGVNLVDGSLRQGLDIADTYVSSEGPAAGKPDFTLAQMRLSRLQSLGASPWSLYGELVGQYAFDVLPSSERLFLGGSTVGRGFAPGNTSGDSGYGVRVELQRYLGPESLGSAIDAVELYAFNDYGRGYDRSEARDGVKTESLGSAGIGARIAIRQWLSLTPEVARQTVGSANDTQSGSLETRYFLGAIARF